VVVFDRVNVVGIAVAAVIVVGILGGFSNLLESSWMLLYVWSASLNDLGPADKVVGFCIVALAFTKGKMPFVCA
jgi:hypothetical protein